MKKIVMASILLASSSLVAGEYFVGANLSSVDMGAKISGTASYNGTTVSGSASDSDRDTGFNIKVGKLVDGGRIYLQTGKLYDDGILEYTSTTLNYDKFFTKTSNGFTPFLGAHIGSGSFDILGYSETGTEYGIQAGMLKDIDNKMQVEFGLRHTFTSAKFTANESGTYAGNSYSVNGELSSDDGTGFYVGMNYKF